MSSAEVAAVVAAACEDVLGLLRSKQRRDEAQKLVTDLGAIERTRGIAGDVRHQPLMLR